VVTGGIFINFIHSIAGKISIQLLGQFKGFQNCNIRESCYDYYAGIMPDDPDIGDIVTRRHEDMNFIFEW